MAANIQALMEIGGARVPETHVAVEEGMKADTPTGRADDAHWMRCALEQAKRAEAENEVPVGAVIVTDGAVAGSGCNAVEQQQNPTVHAEMQAIDGAVSQTGSSRLIGTTLYVTLEPCAMCAGAIVLARIERLVFGARDPKAGACGSLRNIVQDTRLNHRCEVVGGVLEQECGDLLRSFFARLRATEDEKK